MSCRLHYYIASLLLLTDVTSLPFSFLFFFNDTATTEIYTLSLHDALPISRCRRSRKGWTSPRTRSRRPCPSPRRTSRSTRDRKSTRLNSSHVEISYAVFCLKKKKQYKK